MKQFLVLLFLNYPVLIFSQHTSTSNNDTIFCGNAAIVFHHRCADTQNGISFVHVHENETTAVQAANYMMDSLQKGCFTTWQCQQQRFVDFNLNDTQYRFDPNRIYTPAGIKATLASNGKYSPAAALQVKSIGEEFKKNYVNGFALVVALHNNSDGGGLSINSYQKGSVYAKDAKAVFVNPKQDTDDFFYTTNLSYYNFLKSKSYNVVLQNNATVRDDGSLSVFCGNQQIPYLNIEAQDDHLSQQIKMLKIVLELINKFIKQ